MVWAGRRFCQGSCLRSGFHFALSELRDKLEGRAKEQMWDRGGYKPIGCEGQILGSNWRHPHIRGLTAVFNAFTFNVMIDLVRFMPTSGISFYISCLCSFVSPLLPSCIKWIFFTFSFDEFLSKLF